MSCSILVMMMSIIIRSHSATVIILIVTVAVEREEGSHSVAPPFTRQCTPRNSPLAVAHARADTFSLSHGTRDHEPGSRPVSTTLTLMFSCNSHTLDRAAPLPLPPH